jgi:exodeoxyribonuclease VII large subunit
MEENRPLTVSEITELIRISLEGSFDRITVEGEVSNCRPSSTGHLYFVLKDRQAVLQAVMFKNRLRSLDFEVADGLLVRATGSISVYAQRGTYQLICEGLQRAGTGDILALLEERKQRLAREGLFDQARKKPLPRFPQTVAVVSSPTGAAIRDILNVLQRRAAGIRVIILPAPVQGTDAAPIIAQRIGQANRWNLAEVLIVGRGGGSLEDLLPFSEEEVVRAIAESRIPVISAVGHEIDWALSDFAADLRAPTPSAAAELVSQNRAEALERVRDCKDQMYRAIKAKTDRARLLARPFAREDLEFRFRSILQPRLVRFDDAKENLLLALSDRIREGRRRLELAVASLEAASPRAILERGFSVVVNQRTGRILRDAATVELGDPLLIQPERGRLVARTEKTEQEGGE